MRNNDIMTDTQAATLTYELVAARPDWKATATMAALNRVHGAMSFEQITAIARAAVTSPSNETLQKAFDDFLAPQQKAAPATEPGQTASPTYELRVLIDDIRHGMAIPQDLDDALDELETMLGIPRTAYVEPAAPESSTH